MKLTKQYSYIFTFIRFSTWNLHFLLLTGWYTTVCVNCIIYIISFFIWIRLSFKKGWASLLSTPSLRLFTHTICFLADRNSSCLVWIGTPFPKFIESTYGRILILCSSLCKSIIARFRGIITSLQSPDCMLGMNFVFVEKFQFQK